MLAQLRHVLKNTAVGFKRGVFVGLQSNSFDFLALEAPQIG